MPLVGAKQKLQIAAVMSLMMPQRKITGGVSSPQGPNSPQRQLTIVIGRFPPAEDGTVNVSSFQWHGARATEPFISAVDRGCG